MTIRILHHDGTAHQLSPRMTILFNHELRRIGEQPSSSTVTVNLWVSNQTPEELLQILRRMPAQPTGANNRGGTQVPQPERSGLGHANEDLKPAPVPTNLFTHVPIAQQAGLIVPLANAPRESIFQGSQFLDGSRRYNSVYQRETGHLFADPFGVGEMAHLPDGRSVNVREEWLKERREREERDGGKDRKAEREEKGDWGI